MGIKHLYIHVPFCRTICYYCDFCHRVYDEKLSERWLERLGREIEENCRDFYETVYIGGGTPTSLNDDQLDRLLGMIDPYAGAVKEYTIEANPESLDQNKIDIMKKHGINRVSMGLQSADEEILKTLGRRHNFWDVKDKVILLKNNGISNISIDLMYSLPGQTMAILDDTLDKVLELDVPHISLYSLTIEENTVFGKKGIRPLDEEIEADMYELIEKKLTAQGYLHYEISNYCKAGYESRHNLGYWNYDDFLGVSAGAASKIGNRRYTNTKNLLKYLEGDDIIDEDLHLEKKDLMFENVMMSLRTSAGLDLKIFRERYGAEVTEAYPEILKNENLRIEEGKLICTRPEILNRILMDLLD